MRRMATCLLSFIMMCCGCERSEPIKVPLPSPGKSSSGVVPVDTEPAAAPHPELRKETPPEIAPPPPAEATVTKRPDGAQVVSFKGFTMEIPADWVSQEVPNPMRAAQFEWPAAGGGDKPLLIVFYFGPGSGGGVQANIDRWRGQFVESGAPSAGTTDSFSTDSAKITVLDKTGTYKDQPQMMSPEFTAREGYRMLAAAVEIEGGPVFFKAVGPEQSVAAQKEAFLAAVKTLRRGS